MVRYISKCLLLTIYCVVVHGSKRYEKLIYAPYGPKMCREFCQDSAASMSFVKENLSCLRLQRDSHFTCSNEDKLQSGGLEGDIRKDSQDAFQTENRGKHNSNITLHQACRMGNLELVKYLISQQMADINHRGRSGRTPVMVAAYSGQEEVVDYLVCQGCNISLVDDYNDNVLHIACEVGNIKIVKRLVVNMKCDMESRGKRGATAVMNAVYHGHKDVFDFLVSKDCDLRVVDTFHYNLLHIACIGGHVDLVKTILSLKIHDIESRGLRNMTPVMVTVQEGHKDVFHLLESKGCILTSLDEYKNNILHYTSRYGHLDLAKYVLSNKIFDIESRGFAERTPVMMAADTGKMALFDYFVSEGCDLKVVDKYKNNILHVACLGGHPDMVKHILSKGICGIESEGYNRQTPVLMAAHKGHIKLLDILRNEACNLRAEDKYGNSILHLACLGGHADMVKHLLYLKVPETKKNNYGITPVQVARSKGHSAVVTLLQR